MAGGQLPFGFAPQGELTAYEPTLREKAADWLRLKLFTDDRAGQDKANRLVNWGETMIPPFGFATSAYDAGRAGGEGDYATSGMIGAMAVIPGFHGSPVKTLRKVSARPVKRQFDNATSQFGAFFAPEIAGAKKYAGESGQIYKANVDLQNPYEMDWSEFRRWQNISKTAKGKYIDPPKWEARGNALKEASAEFVTGLKAAGHDGVIIRKPDGAIAEIASFNDVPVEPASQGVSGAIDALQAKYPNVKLDISSGSTGLTLSRIEVPKGERGKGVGTAVMNDLADIADANGLPVALSPSGDFGGSVSRLKDFYKRFGFVPNRGRNKDFTISESYIRLPKSEGK